jgi:lycopene beta-cyclase
MASLMPTPEHADVAIIGAGVAGLTLAAKLAERDPSIKIVLLGPVDNRNQRLSFWTDQAPRSDEAVLTNQWRQWCFNHRHSGRVVQNSSQQRYVSLDAKAYKALLRGRLTGTRCTQRHSLVASIDIGLNRSAVHCGDEIFTAATVIDTRAPRIPETTLKQQFWGTVVEFSRPHQLDYPVLMDFAVTPVAREGVTFIYALPLTAREMLVEATTFSTQLQEEADYQRCVGDWIQQHFALRITPDLAKSESGILPMGPVRPLEPGLPQCGLAGGAARSSTGYAFRGIERQAEFMASQLVAGLQPVSRSPYSRKADWMDLVFLHVAKNQPEQLVRLFMSMATQLTGDDFAHFLSDTGGWRPCFRGVMAAPKGPFLQAALQLLWKRSWTG